MSDETREIEESPLAEKKKETSGEYLWRVLKPVGCFVVLLIFAVYLVFCFTYKSDPAQAPNAAPSAQTQSAD